MASRQVIQRGVVLVSSTCKSCSVPLVPSVEQAVMVHNPMVRSCRPAQVPCPPPNQACPPPEGSLLSKGMAALWFLTKLGLVGGVIKLTSDQGLWGSGEESEDLAKRVGLIPEDYGEQKEKNRIAIKNYVKSLWNHLLERTGELFDLKP